MEIRYALKRFTEVARSEILRDHIRASCVAATWISIEVFRRLGFQAAPLEVKASVGNGAYGRRVVTGQRPTSIEQLLRWGTEDGSYVVGIGKQGILGGLGGHLVALVEATYLVDSSLDQAASTANDLKVPSVVVIQLQPSELASGVVRRVDPDLFIEYVVSPVAAEYTNSPDWGMTTEVKETVDCILSRMGMLVAKDPSRT